MTFSSSRLAVQSDSANDELAQPYEVNEAGETYGSALAAEYNGAEPDWVLAKATNGEEGYVRSADLQMPEPKNPEDAVENFSVQRVKSIPVYAEPSGSGEVVGQFDMYYGG